MKTLAEILESGTPSEKELAILAQKYPARSVDILNSHSKKSREILGITGIIAAASIAQMYHSWRSLEETAWPLDMLGFFGAITGIIGVGYALNEIKKNMKASWLLYHPEDKSNDTPNYAEFYTHKGTFTCAPTAVETLLATPIYPLDEEDTFNVFHRSGIHKIYGFVPQMCVEELNSPISAPTMGCAPITLRSAQGERFHFPLEVKPNTFPYIQNLVNGTVPHSFLVQVAQGVVSDELKTEALRVIDIYTPSGVHLCGSNSPYIQKPSAASAVAAR